MAPHIAIVSAESFSADALSQAVVSSFPGTKPIIYNWAAEALTAVGLHQAEFCVLDPQMPDIDGLDYIPEIIESRYSLKTFIVSNRMDERTLCVLGAQKYDGWMDTASENSSHFSAALANLGSGRRYLSESIRTAINSIKNPTNRLLSDHEEKILSLLGTGSDDTVAAAWLKIAPATVRCHRARIMRKLSLHHKGELMNFARNRGYIRFSAGSALHPGFQRWIAGRGGRFPDIADFREAGYLA